MLQPEAMHRSALLLGVVAACAVALQPSQQRLAPRRSSRRLAPRASLEGATHACSLDFGRETGTWMPPRWASYGRTEFALDLKYAAGGVVEVVDGPRPLRGLALGTNYRWRVTGGTWRVDTDAKTRRSTLRVQLAHDGLSVADCVLDAGDVSLSIPVFVGQSGTTVSRKEGLMSIVAYRLLVRKERRLVGVFYAQDKHA